MARPKSPMTSSARALARILAVLTPREASRITNRQLADLVNRHERTVTKGLAELEGAGLIRVERRSPNSGGPGTDPTGRTIVWTGGELA